MSSVRRMISSVTRRPVKRPVRASRRRRGGIRLVVAVRHCTPVASAGGSPEEALEFYIVIGVTKSFAGEWNRANTTLFKNAKPLYTVSN